jgi:hypothetical protein
MKMKEFEVNNSEEFEELIDGGNIEITIAIVETILNNLKGKKRHIPAMSILLKEEEMIMDVTVDREDFIYVLETNLPKYEAYEMYEKCIEIVNGISFLKEKEKKAKKH